MIKAENLKTDKLVLDIESFEVLRVFVACNVDDESVPLLDALYDRYILHLDRDDIKSEKTRAVFNALVAIIDHNTAEDAKPAPQPPKTFHPKMKPLVHLSDRTKFFVGLIWVEMARDSERVVWAVKDPVAFAREKGLESECTPKVLEELTAWTSRVKDITITRSAWEWAKTFKDKIARRQFKDPSDWSFYSTNFNPQQRN